MKFKPHEMASALLFTSIFLGLAGSNISIFSKIRPFHFGAVFGVISIILMIKNLNLKLRDFKEFWLFLALALPQLLWVQYLERYFIYFLFLCIGFIYFYIGKISFHFTKTLKPRAFYLILLLWAVLIALRVIFENSPDALGGPFGNMNNMATALVVLLLVNYILFNSSNLILYTAAFYYASFLNRRAAFLALVLFAVLDCALEFVRKKEKFYKKISAYCIIIALGASLDATSLFNLFAEYSDTNYVLHPASSDGVRLSLLLQMLDHLKHLPYWQLITGNGLGQLHVEMPAHPGQWASPHLFWLEMYFYLGVVWLAAIAWLFLKSDTRSKVALLTLAVVGIAMSSMIYFVPFYLLMGIITKKQFDDSTSLELKTREVI